MAAQSFCRCALVLLTTLALLSIRAALGDEPRRQIWIYRDVPDGKDERSESEKIYDPYGIMPATGSSRVAVDTASPVKGGGTAVEVIMALDGPTDWLGTYWLLDNGAAWGSKKGENIQALLQAEDNEPIVLRFRAWGDGVVTFKTGGVNVGHFPSSLKLAVERGPIALTESPRDMEIGPVAANRLRNIIDPLAVISASVDNGRGKKNVRVLIDDVRFERASESIEKPLPARWRERLERTLWIAYTPTGFDPTIKPVKQPQKEAIQADLVAIQSLAISSGVPKDRIGVISYGCDNGLEQIVPVASELGIHVMQGIFNPRNEVEIANAKRIIADDKYSDAIAAVVIGNESLTFRRANMEEISARAKALRQIRGIPWTTTEIVQAYGNRALFDCDFTLLNCHALFSGIVEPAEAADWACKQVSAVLEQAPKGQLVIVKEFGFPAGPAPFSEIQQESYWRSVLAHEVAKQANVAIFDGLDNVPWKRERIRVPTANDMIDIGPFWPVLFGPERTPKAFAPQLIRLWLKTRSGD